MDYIFLGSVLIAIVAFVLALITSMQFRPHLKCLFGFHLPGEHCGEVKIRKMDGETGEIDYGNVLRCPRCKKAIGLDNLH